MDDEVPPRSVVVAGEGRSALLDDLDPGLSDLF